MPPLADDLRTRLEKAVIAAREKAERGGAPKAHPTNVRASQTGLRSLRNLACPRKRPNLRSRSPSGAPPQRLPERPNAPTQLRPRSREGEGASVTRAANSA